MKRGYLDKMCVLIGIVSMVTTLIINPDAAQYTVLSRLLTQLRDGYDKDALPKRHSGSYVAVKVYPAIVRIEDLNEEKEELSTAISLSMGWNDERLAWDPRDNAGITEIHVPAIQVWLPDIAVHNTIYSPDKAASIDQLVEVSYLGNVVFVRVVHARSYCHVNFTWFPYDQHTCDIIFSSWIYSVRNIMMEFWHDDNSSVVVPVLADTDSNIVNIDGHKWQLRGRKAHGEIYLITYSCCPGESYAQLRISLTVKRTAPILVYVFLLPMLAISALVPLQFLPSYKASQRHAYGLLLVFGEILPLILLCLYLPGHAYIPFIGVINIWCLVSASLALVLSSITSNIVYINKGPLPVYLKKFLKKVQCLSTSKQADNRNEKTYLSYNTAEHQRLMGYASRSSEMEPNGITNEPNGITNEPNGITNEPIEMSTITQRTNSEIVKSTLLDILNELKLLHSLTNKFLSGHEEPDWLTLATALDKVFFLLFLVLFILESLSVCLSM